MRGAKKIIINLILIVVFILLGTGKVKAAGNLYLQNLDYQVQIYEDGSMDVTETWKIDIEETNTLFKTFKTDEEKYTSITNVQVSDITDEYRNDFTEINELMYHVTRGCYYGLINDDGDFEIAWGVGLDNTSASKIYEISYTVEDAIAKYTDYAELYWQFIGSDFEISSKKISGTITLPETNPKEEIKVWGHTEGLNGEIYVTDDREIEFQVDNFNAGRYVEIRALFPTNNIISSNRTYEEERLEEVIAEETVWANEANERRQKRERSKKAFTAIFIGICILIGISIGKNIKKISEKTAGKTILKPTINLKYYREIPRKQVTPAQALFIYRNATTNFSAREMGRIFSATLLNLSLKKYIEIQNNVQKKLMIKILKRESEGLEKSEEEVLKYIVKAAKEENEITMKDLEKYMKNHASDLISVKSTIEDYTKEELEKKEIYDPEKAKEKIKYGATSVANIITIVIVALMVMPFLTDIIYSKALFVGGLALIILIIIKSIVSNKYYNTINQLTQKGIDEQEMWRGLIRYMEEFSLIDKREVPEVVIWEEFLVYATVFGIAGKVLEQLKIVYRELGQEINIDDYGYMYLMMNTDFSEKFSSSINSAFSSAYSQTYSSGSGSGGGFSGGGGGGRRPEEAVVEDKTNHQINTY